MDNQKSGSPMILYLAGVLFIIWGVLGMMDAKNYVDVGFQTGDDNSVVYVEAGSPAETAGFMVGDVVKLNGGIDQNNNKELSERRKPVMYESML